MFDNFTLAQLQQLWWLIVSVIGALFVFLTFVQGGQSLLSFVARNDLEKSLVINSLGRKWELTFTTLVLFGGALFAAFPLFYATSFGGAYWIWIAILFTFVLQAVSFEFRKKPGNLLGARTYELFLFLNGTIGILLIGIVLATFFSGSSFQLDDYNQVLWQHPMLGLETAFSFFNVSFGIFLVLLARTLGALYLLNNIDFRLQLVKDMEKRLRKAVATNLIGAIPFLLYFMFNLATVEGYAVKPESGEIFMESGKYLQNLLAMPGVLAMLAAGLLFILLGAAVARRPSGKSGIWFSGLGSILVALSLFLTAGFNNTAFYPSSFDLNSSLTIYNASSSRYTLTAMSYIALAVPLVLAYIAYFWRKMDREKLSTGEVSDFTAKEIY
ncbi:MAG: cytochrome d ubiquinol oxidase subunit II [Desulfobulbaceae bacterium]|jgi:cytochrome d ubiquinol oxidase subunit II|nr:cytochrome d ubiquinol oxidase subunit II [Desulfobulbaceae bacterium]MDH3997022.1 cytochrome d ubiquinol oxidase subunit II [Desulfobulbaceae bacterium]HKJ14731.1 cytochrome d ubiquinol oxidase subunit II [Desulfobulbales bacterium]